MEADVDVQNIDSEDGMITVLCPPTDYFKTKNALQGWNAKVDFEVEEITYLPQTEHPITGDDAAQFERFAAMLNDLEDVQQLYHNAVLNSGAKCSQGGLRCFGLRLPSAHNSQARHEPILEARRLPSRQSTSLLIVRRNAAPPNTALGAVPRRLGLGSDGLLSSVAKLRALWVSVAAFNSKFQ